MSVDRFNSETRMRGDAHDQGLVRTRVTFELDFDVWSATNQCYAADIREGPGRVICGVLYDVPDVLITRDSAARIGRRSLDAVEGQRYRRVDIEVERLDGIAIAGPVFTYTVIAPEPTGETSLEYATHILRGLATHNAPAEYVQYIKTRIVHSNRALAEPIAAM
jgi:hypothetical protein